MKRPQIMPIVFVLLFHAAVWAGQPNVVLIMTDDQGYGDMSCHGNLHLKTPNIDQLYRESVRLTDFHVDPTCSPTRAALMTGRYSSRVGVWLTYGGRHHLRADEATMADVFDAAGYRTAMFGKWHLGDNYPFRPQDRGFQESFCHGGGVVGEAPDYWGNDNYDDTYFHNGLRERAEGYCTDVWFDRAIRFIEQNKDVPFFIYLPTNAAHGPRNVPWKYADLFTKEKRINASTARSSDDSKLFAVKPRSTPTDQTSPARPGVFWNRASSTMKRRCFGSDGKRSRQAAQPSHESHKK